MSSIRGAQESARGTVVLISSIVSTGPPTASAGLVCLLRRSLGTPAAKG